MKYVVFLTFSPLHLTDTKLYIFILFYLYILFYFFSILLKAILRLKGNYEEGRAEASALKVFKHLDKNKDQTLSQEEFVNGASKSQAIMAILQGVF